MKLMLKKPKPEIRATDIFISVHTHTTLMLQITAFEKVKQV